MHRALGILGQVKGANRAVVVFSVLFTARVGLLRSRTVYVRGLLLSASKDTTNEPGNCVKDLLGQGTSGLTPVVLLYSLGGI